jgi:DNA-binding transcriptional MerR regulator
MTQQPVVQVVLAPQQLQAVAAQPGAVQKKQGGGKRRVHVADLERKKRRGQQQTLLQSQEAIQQLLHGFVQEGDGHAPQQAQQQQQQEQVLQQPAAELQQQLAQPQQFVPLQQQPVWANAPLMAPVAIHPTQQQQPQAVGLPAAAAASSSAAAGDGTAAGSKNMGVGATAPDRAGLKAFIWFEGFKGAKGQVGPKLNSYCCSDLRLRSAAVGCSPHDVTVTVHSVHDAGIRTP